MVAEPQVPFSAGTHAPKLAAPAGACDCHMHIYDSRFPPAPGASLRPPDASVADYRRLQGRLRTARNVVVTPSKYGTDNRCTLEAIAEIGPTARGVAVVEASVSDAELRRLDGLGVRGIRFNFSRGATTTVDMIAPLSRRVHELGWHVQLLMPASLLVELQDLLRSLPSAIVFDHLGRVPLPESVASPAFAVIRRLIDSGRTWVKLSGAYLFSKAGGPDYPDVAGLAKAFVTAAPERVVWGTDWPHAVASAGEQTMPDDADLLDLLLDWAPDDAVRRRILVDNPAGLYDFPPTTRSTQC